MDSRFDADELAILIEALTAWVNKDEAGEMLGDMVTMLLAKDPEKAKTERDQKHKELEAVKDLRKERAIIIQAKLIQMKDETVAASIKQAP